MPLIEQRPAEPAQKPGRRAWPSGWMSVASIALITTGLGALCAFGAIFALMTAYLFTIGGLAYGLVGMGIIAFRWITVPRQERGSRWDDGTVADVGEFRTAAQRLTFAFNLVLLVNLAVAALLTGVATSEWLSIICGCIAQVCGLALIIANGHWAYGRRYIVGEHEAMTNRAGRYRLIVANRILAFVVWVSYTAVAGFFVISVLGITWS